MGGLDGCVILTCGCLIRTRGQQRQLCDDWCFCKALSVAACMLGRQNLCTLSLNLIRMGCKMLQEVLMWLNELWAPWSQSEIYLCAASVAYVVCLPGMCAVYCDPKFVLCAGLDRAENGSF